MTSLLESLQQSYPNIEEENDTNSIEVINIPLNSKRKNMDDNSYKSSYDDSYLEKLEEMYNRLNEITYNDYKNDSSSSTRQKINGHVVEINKRLKEVEQMLTHASKLKLESGSDQRVFWKSTVDKFQKIDQRLGRLSNKIREMNS